MGKTALEGRPGISKVTRGWRQGQEINTVFYDPDKISLAQMIDVLKMAGTYKGIASKPVPVK